MFDKQEKAVLKGMFEVHSKDMREETRALIAASENRMNKRFDTIDAHVMQILELLDAHVLSPIADLQSRTTRIEKHLNLV